MSPQLLIITALLVAGDRPVDFNTEIIPVLTKAGCNAAACHGSKAGRGGFRLSLYGSEPDADYQAIALELEGRRINIASPPDSLVLRKPTGEMDHEGGDPLDPDGEGTARLLKWITDGAPESGNQRLSQLRVSPVSSVVNLKDKVSIRATATFADSTNDVTRWTVLTPEDASAVKIDPVTGVAEVLRRGRHIVVARFLDRVIPIELIVPLSAQPIDHSREPRGNFIDDYVYKTLETLRLPVSPVADDTTFLRRIRLDLTGRLPTPKEVREFSASKKPEKRTVLVDRLIQTDAFVDYWTWHFARLLRIRSQPQDTAGARAFYAWLRDQIKNGNSYNQMAQELVTATGDSHKFGPANFYRGNKGPREQAEFVSELFMGVRLRCANCHNHPLDQWTQDDYHGLAAVFAKIESGRFVKLGRRGEVTHPKTGKAAVPRIPGERFLEAKTDGRAALADWLTDSDNPYFSRAVVNRLWKSMMGRGLVEPADDLRATNPATHPELLDQLASDFAKHNFDIRRTLRMIATSTAYARTTKSTDANHVDDRYYSHALVRPLEAEVLADALSDATGVAEKYGDEPLGTRAIALFDGRLEAKSLDILGRCSREESCDSATSSGGLSRKLHMINGALINQKIAHSSGRLQKMLATGKSGDDLIEEFYLRCLSRLPTPDEREYWNHQIGEAQGDKQKRQLAEDFVWSLLSCREFVTNH